MKKPDLLLSFLTSRRVYSCRNRGSCGRAKMNCFIVRIFFFSFSFSFPINTCQGFKAKSLAKARASAPAQAKKMGLNREQSEALFQHCGVGKVGQGRKCRFDRTGN